MRPLSVIVVLSSLLLAGCVSSPSTTPSERKLGAGALGLTAASTPPIADTWWNAFHDPQLDALEQQASANSPTLHAALARMREAQAELSQNRAATYPQVNFDAQETRERFSKSYIIPPPYGGTTQWIGTIQADLSWDIDFWGRQAAMVEKARTSADAAALDAQAARLALSGAVATTYVHLASAYVLEDAAAEAVKERAEILALTNTRFRNGLENASAIKEAQAQFSQARETLTAAGANRALGVHALAALAGRGADMYATVGRPTADLETSLPLPATLPADLLSHRPDILAAEARIDAATSGREAARTAFYPDVNLMALAGWAAIGLGPLFTNNALNYGAGPAVHLPIFDAGKLRAEYAGATAELDASVADYNAAVVNAVKETADALTQSKALQSQVRDEADAVSSARAAFKIAQTRYRSGLNPQLNVLVAEDTLIAARRAQAQLDGDAASARVSLLLAVGGGFNSPGNEAAKRVSVEDKAP